MIDYTEVRRAVETLIKDNFVLLPLILENTTKRFENKPHVEVTDQPGSQHSMEMGSGVALNDGTISIHIYTEAGSGTNLARASASFLIDLFQTSDLQLQTESAEFISGGYVKDTNLYVHVLKLPYSYFYGQDDANSC